MEKTISDVAKQRFEAAVYVLGVDVELLKSRCRRNATIHDRWMVWWLVLGREMLDISREGKARYQVSMEDAAAILGRDHTSVHGLQFGMHKYPAASLKSSYVDQIVSQFVKRLEGASSATVTPHVRNEAFLALRRNV